MQFPQTHKNVLYVASNFGTKQECVYILRLTLPTILPVTPIPFRMVTLQQRETEQQNKGYIHESVSAGKVSRIMYVES